MHFLIESLERRIQFALTLPAGSFAQASDYYRFSLGTVVPAPGVAITGISWGVTRTSSTVLTKQDFRITMPSGLYSPALLRLVTLGLHTQSGRVDEFDSSGNLRTSWVMGDVAVTSFSQTGGSTSLVDTFTLSMTSMDTTFNQLNESGSLVSQVRTIWNFNNGTGTLPSIQDTFFMSTEPEPTSTVEFGRGQMPLTDFSMSITTTTAGGGGGGGSVAKTDGPHYTTVAGREGNALLAKVLTNDPSNSYDLAQSIYTKRDSLARPSIRWRFQDLNGMEYSTTDTTLDAEPRSEFIRFAPARAQVLFYDYDANNQMLAPVSNGFNFTTGVADNPSGNTAYIAPPTYGLVNSPLDSIDIHLTTAQGFFPKFQLTYEGIDPNTITASTSDGGFTWTLGNLAEQQVDGGSYAIKLFAINSGFANLIGSTGISWTVDSTPPAVLGSSFASSGVAPSPYRISLQLSEPVTAIAGGAPLLIRNAGTGQIIQVAYGFVQADGVTIFADLPDTLPDGNYTADLPAGGVYDAAGNLNADSFLLDLHVLAADANDDRIVDTQDFNLLAGAFGESGKLFSEGNLNYDALGLVDSEDFNLLVSRYGNKLPQPAGGALVQAGNPLFADSGDKDEYALNLLE